MDNYTGKCLKYKNKSNEELLLYVLGQSRDRESKRADVLYINPSENIAGYKTIVPFNEDFINRCHEADPTAKEVFRYALPDIAFLEAL